MLRRICAKRRSDSGLKASCPSTTQRTESVILIKDFGNSLSQRFLLLHLLRQKRGEILNSPAKNMKTGIPSHSDGVNRDARVNGYLLLHFPTPKKRQFYKSVATIFSVSLSTLTPPFPGSNSGVKCEIFVFSCKTSVVSSSPYYLAKNTTALRL